MQVVGWPNLKLVDNFHVGGRVITPDGFIIWEDGTSFDFSYWPHDFVDLGKDGKNIPGSAVVRNSQVS